MFDSLQEGIIVVQGGKKIHFMNDISNKILSRVSNLYDFFKNLDDDENVSKTPCIDRKIFYLFENDKSKKKKKNKDS